MRKMIIELQPNDYAKDILNRYIDFEKIESLETLELLRADILKKEKIQIVEITVKPNVDINDIKFPYGSEILYVLNQTNNKYLCVLKWKITNDIFDGIKKLQGGKEIELMRDSPNIITKDSYVLSAIGKQNSISFFIDYIKKIGTIIKISYVKPIYFGSNILSCLTEKQRKTILMAKKLGYYEYPRKINSEKLAEKLGISTPTVIEHLRKAEIRLLDQILTGY
jgi:DNA binding protein with HTH domain